MISARYLADGNISAVIDGAEWGVKASAVSARDGQIPCMIADWVDAGGVIAAYEPPPLTADDFGAAIQSHVDATAKSRGYADGVALAGYSTSTIPAWAAEAATFVAWRDAVWIYAYTQLAKVQGGQRAMPTLSDFVAELPAIKWP